MAQTFRSSFLEAFKILPWTIFDDGASGNVFKVEGKPGRASPVPGVEIQGLQFIVKLVKLPSGVSESPVKELREVELLEANGIEGDNVVKIFGNWEESPPMGFEYPNRPAVNEKNGRILFILMEYCDLFTLRRWLGWPRQKKSWNDLLNLFVQVTKGLCCIHQHRIIHRDLKPSNIGLKCNWKEEVVVAKLIDFGLATKYRDAMTSKVGTHLYRSPESHQSGEYDEKADIYALGIILCQMMVSLVVEDVSVGKLEEEFRQFVEETMSSSYTPQPFDALVYLGKYGVVQDDSQVSQLVQLAKEMTLPVSQERPSSLEIFEKMKLISPEGERLSVCIYNYLEVVSEEQVWHSSTNPTSLSSIRTSRLNHLTHLTLKNIRVTQEGMLETLRECLALKQLSLSLLISDLRQDELLSMESICLPFLNTFRFRELTSSDHESNRKPGPRDPVSLFGVRRIQSLLFFGPISQIWEKNMRVKVSYGKRVLMNIDADTDLFFYLCNVKEGLGILEILNHVEFRDVTLKRLSGKSVEDIVDLNKCLPSEKQREVLCLNLTSLPRIDLMGGRLFQGFSCLKELSVTGSFGLPFKVIEMHLLPPTINRLFIKWIHPEVTGMSEIEPRKLETLKLSVCEVSRSFYEKYDRMFEVESLHVASITRGSKIAVLPDFSYVETFLNTSNWKEVTLDPFDWTETPENSQFRNEFISSFFSGTDEKLLKDHHGIVLELIEGNAVARLLGGIQVNQLKGSIMVDSLLPNAPVDSDDNDEERELLHQQGLSDYLDVWDRRRHVYVTTEELDNDLEENFCFKGTLSQPTYPEEGWDRLVLFEKFLGVSKNKTKLKHIEIRDCSVSPSLPLQLRGCVNLVSLGLEMVELESEAPMKMTSSFPRLETFSVNLYSSGGLNSEYFTFESFDQLFFFRPGPERMKGLWVSGVECRVSVQGTLHFELSRDSLSLQFLPEVDRILSSLGVNETLETLKVHCCLFRMTEGSLPPSIVKLCLRYVEVTFRELCERGHEFPYLKTLIFEGHGFEDLVDLELIGSLGSLEHLTICNVSLIEMAKKLKRSLKSCTLRSIYPHKTFDKTFARFLNSESIVLANESHNSFTCRTLYELLKSGDEGIRSAIFINYNRNGNAEDNEYLFCEDFLLRNGINGIQASSFRVQLEGKSTNEWTAGEIFPGESEDSTLEGYLETEPQFPNRDREIRAENLKRLKDKLVLPKGHFSVFL